MKALKHYLLIVCFCIISINIYCQENKKEITGEEWDKLIQLLSTEKWSDAEKLSLKYLNKFNDKDDSLADPAIVRYMYIRCVAARLAEKEYSPEKALDKVKDFTGKTIVTPPRTFRTEGIFNFYKLTDDKKALFLCASNKEKITIQAFETFEMADTTLLNDVSDLEGKDLRLGAFIKSIKTGGVTMPHFEIVFENAFLWNDDEDKSDDDENE